ncbi:MAG: SDR family oxidoreductase [Geodermatophilaceae bacterium]
MRANGVHGQRHGLLGGPTGQASDQVRSTVRHRTSWPLLVPTSNRGPPAARQRSLRPGRRPPAARSAGVPAHGSPGTAPGRPWTAGRFGRGVRANALCPTVILTEMAERVWSAPGKAELMLVRIPVSHFGRPDDVAGAVLYLVSPAADMVNGWIWHWTAATPPPDPPFRSDTPSGSALGGSGAASPDGDRGAPPPAGSPDRYRPPPVGRRTAAAYFDDRQTLSQRRLRSVWGAADGES